MPLESFRQRRLADLRPSPENDRLYRPVDRKDPDIVALAASIREHGLREPIVHSIDDWIISGHRRHVAARLAGLTSVPCRAEAVRRSDYDVDGWLVLLREHNRQRDKSFTEKLHEEIVSVNPHHAYQSLIDDRAEAAKVKVKPIEIGGVRKRARITAAKQPMLDAILVILDAGRDFWPFSDRRIHYGLLNDPPLKHASKPNSRYDNTPKSYGNLTKLLTRARLAGLIPMEAIDDETRPVVTWAVHRDVRTFIRGQLNGLLKGYWRDLLQSQPNQIEILCEKNTLAPILKPVAAEFCIPLITGRGFSSLPPRRDMAARYWASGKNKLIPLIVGDFDPDGEEIARSFARSMRDDFHIENIHPIKVALTQTQTKKYKLQQNMLAKEKSPNYARFVAKYGTNVWEVEALRPQQLQAILRDAIDSVLDRAAFNRELDAEKADAAHLEGVRRTVLDALKGMDFEDAGAV
ncbi:MAG TPA: ParB N-terminal domain-containing protein [Pirellulales bacterium]|nr:ParB N-terminal domain-containing protein [Pirellulales bacterium]